MVLIHGFGWSLHPWEDWATVLEKTYRVIPFDLQSSRARQQRGAQVTGK
jgi:pimeloyl-ACP methyl ester carboxylesterase